MNITRKVFIKNSAPEIAGLSFGSPLTCSAQTGRSGKRGPSDNSKPKMTVVGLGFAGCAMLVHILRQPGLDRGIRYLAVKAEGWFDNHVGDLAINTDFLAGQDVPVMIDLAKAPESFFAGLDGPPENIYKFIINSRKAIIDNIKGSDIVIIPAGLGGTTGTFGSSAVARMARESGALTVAVVTTPFDFEGKRRIEPAKRGILALKTSADMTVVLPNSGIQQLFPSSISLMDLMKKPYEFCYYVVKAFSDIFLEDRLLAPDFSDIKRRFSNCGLVHFGMGRAGTGRAADAVRLAIRSPLLNGVKPDKSPWVICNITASADMTTLAEIQDAAGILERHCHKNTEIIWNTRIEDREDVTASLFVGDIGERASD